MNYIKKAQNICIIREIIKLKAMHFMDLYDILKSEFLITLNK